jgi:hypothetical protein
MALDTTTTATAADAADYFAKEPAAIAVALADKDGGHAVITRDGKVIPAESAEEADRICALVTHETCQAAAGFPPETFGWDIVYAEPTTVGYIVIRDHDLRGRTLSVQSIRPGNQVARDWSADRYSEEYKVDIHGPRPLYDDPGTPWSAGVTGWGRNIPADGFYRVARVLTIVGYLLDAKNPIAAIGWVGTGHGGRRVG